MSIVNPLEHNVLPTLIGLLEDTNLTAPQRTMIEYAIEDFDRFNKLYEVTVKGDDTQQSSLTNEVFYSMTPAGSLQEREASTGNVRLSCCNYTFNHIINSIAADDVGGGIPWKVRDLDLEAASTHVYLVIRYLLSQGRIKKISGSRYVRANW